MEECQCSCFWGPPATTALVRVCARVCACACVLERESVCVCGESGNGVGESVEPGEPKSERGDAVVDPYEGSSTQRGPGDSRSKITKRKSSAVDTLWEWEVSPAHAQLTEMRKRRCGAQGGCRTSYPGPATTVGSHLQTLRPT